MNITSWLLKLYFSGYFLQTAFIAIVFAATVAHFIDKAMGPQSFGILVNTAVVLFAVGLGASLTQPQIVSLFPDDTLRVSVIAVFAGCGILLTTASLRRWLREFA